MVLEWCLFFFFLLDYDDDIEGEGGKGRNMKNIGRVERVVKLAISVLLSLLLHLRFLSF